MDSVLEDKNFSLSDKHVLSLLTRKMEDGENSTPFYYDYYLDHDIDEILASDSISEEIECSRYHVDVNSTTGKTSAMFQQLCDVSYTSFDAQKDDSYTIQGRVVA